MKRPAVVLNVGWVPGISTLQTLGREGVPAYAVDHRADALGFRSRHAHARRQGPRRVDDANAWIEFLVALGDELDAPAPLFALADDDLNSVAAARERLADRFLYPFPDWPVLERIQDKRHQVERARVLGIPTPRTASEPTDELGFPVLVKPSHPDAFRRAFGVKAFRCATRAELDDAWQSARPFEPAVWEWIPGGDDALYTLGSYLSRDGEALGLFCGRKLLQDPPGVGTARVAEALWVDEVVEQGLALLRGLEFHGVSQVEFKRDPRDGVYKLMEVNPRLWQWHSLAAACGVNLAYIAYRDVGGRPLLPATMRRDARTRWAITLKADRRPAPQRPPYVDPLLPWDDPGLALAHLSRLAHLRLRRSRSG
jgi:predicted ATP-grasp superfamily ATP-dependent carboligase